jgi:hypothetical protein
MPGHPFAKILAAALVTGLPVILGACGSMTTYGTGKTAASQTVEDLTGILAVGSSKKQEPINYEPRAPIVEPPTGTASLPPPGSGETTVALSSDWPDDPDEAAKRYKKLIDERAKAGEEVSFTLPDEALEQTRESRPRDDSNFAKKLRADKATQSLDIDAQKKMFAEAKQGRTGSVDVNGNPTRRYLTEPPVEYREPDPNAPVVITEKPKKKGKWAWPNLWPF